MGSHPRSYTILPTSTVLARPQYCPPATQHDWLPKILHAQVLLLGLMAFHLVPSCKTREVCRTHTQGSHDVNVPLWRDSSHPTLCQHLAFSHLLPSSPPQPRRKVNLLIGLIDSAPVSILAKPMTSISTISLAAACQLQLLPLFNRVGFYSCNASLFVPTSNYLYTSKISLQCSRTSGGGCSRLRLDVFVWSGVL